MHIIWRRLIHQLWKDLRLAILHLFSREDSCNTHTCGSRLPKGTDLQGRPLANISIQSPQHIILHVHKTQEYLTKAPLCTTLLHIVYRAFLYTLSKMQTNIMISIWLLQHFHTIWPSMPKTRQKIWLKIHSLS